MPADYERPARPRETTTSTGAEDLSTDLGATLHLPAKLAHYPWLQHLPKLRSVDALAHLMRPFRSLRRIPRRMHSAVVRVKTSAYRALEVSGTEEAAKFYLLVERLLLAAVYDNRGRPGPTQRHFHNVSKMGPVQNTLSQPACPEGRI